MPNIAVVLKEEVLRLARKEVRNETEGLKKATAKYRAEIAELKRRVAALEKQLARTEKKSAASQAEVNVDSVDATKLRFSAKGLRALRQKLELSATDLALLLGVSAQTVYNWEAETTRPRAEQIAAIAAIRGIGKREVGVRLAQAKTSQLQTG